MKQISDLLKNINYTSNHEIGNLSVDFVSTDSRKISELGLFVALKGLTVDGHNFVEDAIQRGCKAVVVDSQEFFEKFSNPDIIAIKVDNSRVALGEITAAFYGNPAAKLSLIGVTGTNGKTTVTYLLESIILAAGGNPGVIGTINYRYNGKIEKGVFTTPEPEELQFLLKKMADEGVTHVLMEVSSHALCQQRLYGLKFDVAIFTNLTRDHLDFHGDMENYFQAKKSLFVNYLKENSSAVIFAEENNLTEGINWGFRLYDEIIELKNEKSWTGRQILSCGLVADKDIYAENIEYNVDHTTLDLNINGIFYENIRIGLVGKFNVKNTLNAAGAAAALGISPESICKGIADTVTVPGRLEKVRAKNGMQPSEKQSSYESLDVYVDYAHTPDAMENVLMSLKSIVKKRLILVFGCGGDRDVGKRYLMGQVAGCLADLVIITSDNSRSESPEIIVAEIQRGIEAAGMGRLNESDKDRNECGYEIIIPRGEAIEKAVHKAKSGDIVLICGKGHETTQITKDNIIFFDDRIEAQKYLN